jgi:putative transposase
VVRLQARFGVSERRACRCVGQHRSSQRHCRVHVADEAQLRARLQLLARRHPRYGYRRIHVLLTREGWACNAKRVQRLWRDEGLKVPRRTRRRRKFPRTPGSVTATYPDHIWALDFVFDETIGGRPIKVLNITDEFTRQALACVAARSIDADRTVSLFEELVEKREVTPQSIRCDNGPELISAALRDWCRFNGVTTSYIEPGAPWQNPYVESFNGKLRDELLNLESFDSLFEAQVLIEDWRVEYNHYRPHQSLRYLTPAEFARRWHAEHRSDTS